MMTIQDWIEKGIERNLIIVDGEKITYVAQDKEYNFADPEEKVRAATYVELVEKYHYSPERIGLEVSVPRRTPNDWADIVVYEDERRRNNYIVVENKNEHVTDPEFKQAIEQGFGNANSLRAKYLLVSSFSKRIAYDVQNFPANERTQNIIGDIPVNYGLVPTYIYKKGADNDLREVSFNELASKFQKCHDIIWSGGKLDPATAFDEMSKLLFAKIQDERNTKNNEAYKFQIGQHENEVIVAQRIIDLYNDARAVDPLVFTESIRIPDNKILEVVRTLQDISLTKTDADAKGQAFEIFLGVVFRGGLGQYFTRRQIVEFAVNLLEPTEDDIILDPSCGSGGFLLYSMKKVIDQIRNDYAGDENLIQRKIYDFSHQRIYGIEINAKIARVAMMDMLVNEDGHTNIENNTGLNSQFKNPNIAFHRFSLILTNPPFGVTIRRNDKDNLGQNSFDAFTFGGNKKQQISDVLFLEQYSKFLTSDQRKKPRIGVVLQIGVLNNPSNRHLLRWLRLNFKILAVVSLPDFAFRKAGSGMKTALLFLQKYEKPYNEIDDIPDYDVFFAVAKHIGYDSTLRPDSNDLPIIQEYYRNHTEDKTKGIFWIKFHSLDYRLDPQYYYNKFQVQLWRENLEEQGFALLPLHALLSKLESGKSPDGGVTRSTGDVPSITVTNITKDGAIDFDSSINFVPESFYQEFNETHGRLLLHDILVAKDGATTGKTAILDKGFPFLEQDDNGDIMPRAIFSEHVFRLRVKKGINPFYINAFLNSEIGQLQLEMITSGGAQGGITREFAQHILVPLVKEQDDIAAQWQNIVSDALSMRRRYKQKMAEAKECVVKAIANATPLTLDEIKKIQNA